MSALTYDFSKPTSELQADFIDTPLQAGIANFCVLLVHLIDLIYK